MVPEIGDIATRGVLTVIARVFVTAIVLIASAGFTYNLIQPTPQYEVVHQIGYEITGINEIIQTSPGPVRIVYLSERFDFEDGFLKINDDFAIKSIKQLPKTNNFNLVLGRDTINYQDFIIETIDYLGSNELNERSFRYPSTANNNDLGTKSLAQFNLKYGKEKSVIYTIPETKGICVDVGSVDYVSCNNENENDCLNVGKQCYWSSYINKCLADKCLSKINSRDCSTIQRDNFVKRDYCIWEQKKNSNNCYDENFLFGEGFVCEDGLVFEKSSKILTLNQKTTIEGFEFDSEIFETIYNNLVDFAEGREDELIQSFSISPNFMILPKVEGGNKLCLYRIIDRLNETVNLNEELVPICKKPSEVSKNLKKGIFLEKSIIENVKGDDSFFKCCGFDISFNEFCINNIRKESSQGNNDGIYKQLCGLDKFSRPIFRNIQGGNGIITNYETGINSITPFPDNVIVTGDDWSWHDYCDAFGCFWFNYDKVNNFRINYFDIIGFDLDIHLENLRNILIPNLRSCGSVDDKVSIPKDFEESLILKDFENFFEEPGLEVACLPLPENLNYDFSARILPLKLQESGNRLSDLIFPNPSNVKVYEINNKIAVYGDTVSLIMKKDSENNKNNVYIGWSNAISCGNSFGEGTTINSLKPGLNNNGVITSCEESVDVCRGLSVEIMGGDEVVTLVGFPLKLSFGCSNDKPICCALPDLGTGGNG